jgi:hypothetical protein
MAMSQRREMQMHMKKLLLVLLLCTAPITAALKYELEKELIEAFCNPLAHIEPRTQILVDITASWIKCTIDDIAIGKITVTEKDKFYISRIAHLACELMNRREYEDVAIRNVFVLN